MTVSRRRFIRWATAMSTLAVAEAGRSRLVPLRGAGEAGFRPNLLSTQKDVWDQQLWMAKLGPKYTGNAAHTEFVEFLAREMSALGLEVARDRYTLPRWDAKRWAISVTSPGASGASTRVPVTSYFPYSGQTSPS
jgi:hypothetical protein